ncbi:hypothetical protein OQY15_20875 [Pedobacter sp. MC2016-15]|uniref:hypothetical protein n=1 Tax=Pedobacter sp. MC2016-15 TaxID=2994473 RepID=UPI0022472823|nr:hypothetical protein [Pedobacter sp. MC2016-15]MCX2481567.1 hypothetical protein [Pedobacter sp. MC2016-15]
MNINNFGAFDAEVWGTVSDWGVFFVTAGTGILVYLTLRSQNKVLKSQQETLSSQLKVQQIEQARFQSEVVPSFSSTMGRVDTEINPENEDKTRTHLGFSIKNIAKNSIKDIDIKVSDTNWLIREPYHTKQLDPNYNLTIYAIGEPKVIISDSGYKSKVSVGCDIEIHYADIFRNRYIHYITYNPLSTESKLYDNYIKRVTPDLFM